MRTTLLFLAPLAGCTTVYSLDVNVRIPTEVQQQALVHTIGDLEKDATP